MKPVMCKMSVFHYLFCKGNCKGKEGFMSLFYSKDFNYGCMVSNMLLRGNRDHFMQIYFLYHPVLNNWCVLSCLSDSAYKRYLADS